jgi:hypothetical protein
MSNTTFNATQLETDRDGAALNRTTSDFKSVSKTAAFTADNTMSGKVVYVTAGSAANVTLPRDLPVGFHMTVVTLGAGQLTFVAASGATVNKAAATAKTLAQYAQVTVKVYSNADGATALYTINGELAAS